MVGVVVAVAVAVAVATAVAVGAGVVKRIPVLVRLDPDIKKQVESEAKRLGLSLGRYSEIRLREVNKK